MELIGTIITIVRTIAGAVYPPLKKKYFDQPKIYLTFQYQSSSKSPKISPKNDTSQPLNMMDVIWINELRWRYKLILNNSEHPAYNIRDRCTTTAKKGCRLKINTPGETTQMLPTNQR